MSARAAASSRILTTPPVVADGKVFAKDAQGTVSAFNADTGALLWRVTLAPEKARDTDEFGGGLAYYGGRLFVTTGFAMVYSLDPNDRQGGLDLGRQRAGARRAAGVRRPRLRHHHRQQAACAGRLRRLRPLAVRRPAGNRGLCRRQQPGRFRRLRRRALHLRRAGGAAPRQRPAGLERIADRRARRHPRLRQPGRHSRAPGDRPRPRDRDGLGRAGRRHRPALGPTSVGP